ncbi:MAG: hypothetical protein CO149_07050 [Nitrospirae bacterium CG_4_9_14_3_um_filter_51_5]|nr:MAG: hypothetical protein CO149_07050 [Nitrospirae bacterium CG_4_9_14_3_um_filter_51_5]
MPSRMTRGFLQPLTCLVFVGLASCQMWTDDSLQKPDAEKGRTIFQESCAVCHGVSGTGDGYLGFNPSPTNLRASTIQKKTDEELGNTIRQGHANTAMGAWRYALSEEEIHAVLGYIRTFRGET